MQKNYIKRTARILLASLSCLVSVSIWAKTEINVETAGTLSSILTSTDKELKVTGFINGSDIKYIRSLVTSGKVTTIDWSEVRIVAGGDAYYGSYKTSDDIIGESMFYNCSGLKSMTLPSTVTSIKSNAFASTGLTKIEIPNSVLSLGEDAFAYCSSLTTVVIGKKVKTLSKGAFYGSGVSKAYVKPITPPSTSSYLFGSKVTIYVYKDALNDYKTSSWKEWASTFYGTLDRFYPYEPDENDLARELCATYFEDAACTQLKPEYQAMSDEDLTASMTAAGMPEYMVPIALKVKNETWAKYEKDFRINEYKAYSDAAYWNEKLWARFASFMGNPTGIYAKNDGDPLYVFVDSDVPEDATLYIATAGVDQMITSAKAGQKLQKGLNVIDGEADKLFYILYTADSKSMTKKLTEWPKIKIHIEGGVMNGYYDASRHTDTDYKALLKNVTFTTFEIKGLHSVMNIRTSILKKTYPNQIHKSIACLDSVAVWENDLFGINESVANGEKAGAPWYLSGGDAFYPGYFNNPIYVDNDSPGSYAHATEFGTHFSTGASEICLNPYISNFDEGGLAHEIGHQHQFAIMLEGFTEGSNDLFSNYCRWMMGHRASTGRPLSVTMQEFARPEAFYWRPIDNSCLRMFFSLYLYYHQAQKNTSFYPELFKALRADRIESQGVNINCNKSGLKFVRKVCEVAQEDLTDFFNVYGFFIPATNRYLECYGDHYVTNRQTDINRTKAEIAQYPKKNTEIIFIEDRVESMPATDFIPAAKGVRYYRDNEKVGQCGDVGQYTSYLPGACEPAEYVYLKADSLYAMEGKGGIGFLMKDAEGNLKYAANAKDICIPRSVGKDFTIYAVDADGTMHEVPRVEGGVETVATTRAGQLENSMSDLTIKLNLSGRINGTDIKYLRKLISEKHLTSLNLTDAQIVSGGTAYYQTYTTSANVLGAYTFQDFTKLDNVKLPKGTTQIGTNAFSRSGLRTVEIPDKVTTIGEDAFAYCERLSTVIIGKAVRTVSKGAFYESKVKDVYVKAATPPSTGGYLFSKNPTIHVYASSLQKYQNSSWAEYGTIVGDLDEWEETTSINEELRVKNEESDKAVYDLSGRKINSQFSMANVQCSMVNGLKKGIYIIDGKKVAVQ